MNTHRRTVCPSCGQQLSSTLCFCPVCMIREVLAVDEPESRCPSLKTPSRQAHQRVPRFEHYELLTDAMEFIEGETLDSLIKRTGRLEVELALEIATQVAAGLAAVYKRHLVHRDIKPSNIVVNLEEGK
jgi:serine/threonine protein kinase